MTQDNVQRLTLSNGLRVYLDPRPWDESTACVLVNGGYAHNQKPETAHLLEHLQGVSARLYGNSQGLNYSSRNAATREQWTAYYFDSFVPNDLYEALKNLASVFREPDTRLLEREKQAVRNELAPMNNPHKLLTQRAYQIILPNYTQRVPGISTRIVSLNTVNEQDCLDFWKTYYMPNNAALYIGGKFSRDVNELFKEFETIKPRELPPKIEWPDEPELRERVEINEKINRDTTTDFRILYKTLALPKISLTDHVSMVTLTNFLNESSGPLYRELRDKNGLSYQVSADYETYGETGIVYFGTTTTKHDDAGQIEEIWLKILNTISRKEMLSDLLDNAKKARKMERLHRWLNMEPSWIKPEILYGISEDDGDKAVDQLTFEDIAKAAQDLQRRKYVVSIALPE